MMTVVIREVFDSILFDASDSPECEECEVRECGWLDREAPEEEPYPLAGGPITLDEDFGWEDVPF